VFGKKDDTPLCPFLNKPCLKHGCMLYTHVQGNNPTTGQQMDHWDCTFKVMPLIMIDQVRKTESVHASTVEARNQAAKHTTAMMQAMMLSNQGGRYHGETEIEASEEPKKLDKK
jgi:hypothetical protein